MEETPQYQKITETDNLILENIQRMTHGEMESAFNISMQSDNFFLNLKECVCNELVRRKEETDLALLQRELEKTVTGIELEKNADSFSIKNTPALQNFIAACEPVNLKEL